ncbi:MAG: hypothetical protein AB1668_02350 [Nanoarchaeota archaeon]
MRRITFHWYILCFIMLGISVFVFFSPIAPSPLFDSGGLTGLTVFVPNKLTPIAAADQLSNNQISPYGGTVDFSDDTTVTLAYGSNAFVTVTEWNQNFTSANFITAVDLACKVNLVADKGEVIYFSYNNGSSWNSACNRPISEAGLYFCNLFAWGINSYEKVNGLDVRCGVEDNNGGSAASFTLDSIALMVNASFEGNKTSETGDISLFVESNIVLTLADNAINFGIIGVNEARSSEESNDFFVLKNDGAVDFNVFAYGIASPFSSTTNGANSLPNNNYLIHANSSASGIINSAYVPVPSNVSTKVLLISGLLKGEGLDTAKLGVRAVVPPDESPGSKNANLVVYVEPS